MGSSFIGNVSDVIMKIVTAEPATLLDIGVGFGRWGFLCRETLDVFVTFFPDYGAGRPLFALREVDA